MRPPTVAHNRRPFKSVEDLKNVSVIDVNKIEAHKDRLYFGGIALIAPKDQE